MSASSFVGAFITFSKYKARESPLSLIRARCSGCSKRLSKNSFGGSPVPLKLEVEDGLGTLDEEADNVALSIVVWSASLADSSDDSSDVSSRELSISEVIAPKEACPTSMTGPREDKDSLCLD